MNRKGFTLIELLAVIVLLIIIFMLVVPSVNRIINQTKEVTHQSQIDTILEAASDFTMKNPSLLPDKNEKTFITLSDLKAQGLVDANIIDPNTKEPFKEDLVISITNVGNSYKNNDKNAKKKGSYLYAIEDTNTSYQPDTVAKPNIILDGFTANSSGDYVTNVDLNSDVNLTNYYATSSSGDDLTSKVTVRIMYNDKAVSSIDTTKSDIYYVYYTVIDNSGVAASVKRTIIIVDNEPPILIIPDKATISSSATSFDLMDGATCTDNSGNCNITTSGNIEFGKSGKYIIEYTAKDPSGNTTTKRRVITVE